MNGKSIKDEPHDRVLPMMKDSSESCPGQLEVPTPREQKALAAMRSACCSMLINSRSIMAAKC